MWEQYRKTFLSMQVVIFSITGWAYYTTRHPSVAVAFVTMQIGAVLGARWAVRLKTKMQAFRS
jgi:hypothetical protein